MRSVIFVLLLLTIGTSAAESPNVYVKRVERDFDQVYKQVYSALEDNRFFVVFEPNIGANLASFAERWGENYNRNRLENVRAMVFCNAWYANEVSNRDPELMALCPLHLTLTHKAGQTSILFVRPSRVAADSPAASVLKEVEDEVIHAIETAVAK